MKTILSINGLTGILAIAMMIVLLPGINNPLHAKPVCNLQYVVDNEQQNENHGADNFSISVIKLFNWM